MPTPSKSHRTTDRSAPSFWLGAILLLTSSMTVMAGATIAPALPEIQRHFADVPRIDYLVRLVLTAPALMIAILAPLSGFMLDRFGRKKPLLGSLCLYAIGGSSGLYLNSIGAILAGRALLGIGVAGLMTATTTLIVDYFSEERRHRFMGLQSAFMGYGGVAFLIIGGLLADISWRGPFAVYLFSLLLIPLAIVVIREPRIDTGDGGGTRRGFDHRAPKLLVALIYTIVFTGFVIFYLIATQLPFLLKELGDVSNAQVGLSIAVNSLVAATVASQYFRLRRHMRPITMVAVMFVLMGAGYLLVAVSIRYWQVVASLMVSGLGFGMLMPNLNVWMARIAPARSRGRLMSGMTMSVFLGQFLSPVITQPIVGVVGASKTFAITGITAWILAAVFGIYTMTRASRRRGTMPRIVD